METLTLEQAYYIAEIVGVLSIVMSLVYVAMQIRQNTTAIRSGTAQAVHQSWGSIYGMMSTEKELLHIILKGVPGLDALTNEEKAQFMSFWHHTNLIWQNAYYQFKTGTLEDKLWHSMERTLMNNHKSNVGYQDYWEQRKSLFSDDYVKYVEQTVASTTVIPGYKIFGVQEPLNGD